MNKTTVKDILPNDSIQVLAHENKIEPNILCTLNVVEYIPNKHIKINHNSCDATLVIPLDEFWFYSKIEEDLNGINLHNGVEIDIIELLNMNPKTEYYLIKDKKLQKRTGLDWKRSGTVIYQSPNSIEIRLI